MPVTGLKISVDELHLLLEAAYLYTDRMERDKAREIFEGVEELRPDAEIVAIGLGNLSLLEGKQTEALKHFKRALSLNPKSALVHAQLGDLYHCMGKKEEALAELKQAKELEPKGAAAEYADGVEKCIAAGIVYKGQKDAATAKKK